ncbi:hypothetical protein GCM10023347_04990 [Streptomyces chumphonensis]|uniref:Uncharacterized protein n=1 Tax=Streptomyces chumphonensis TaxID=1214925 RepID=A0A927F0U2_9ACTN|nr:hypothetical protein [Streptomyces chumphonensis]MBD3933131.1 hypothetical protein [Streptomyces chumphonensis]
MSTMIAGPPRAGNTHPSLAESGGEENRPPLPIRSPGETLPPERRGEQMLAELLTDWSRSASPSSGRRLVAGGWLR